jgi:hypothetical protein
MEIILPTDFKPIIFFFPLTHHFFFFPFPLHIKTKNTKKMEEEVVGRPCLACFCAGFLQVSVEER